jgi:type IV pilus assembly protein PilC
MSTTFIFTGRTRAGAAVSGERIADTVDAAVAALRRDQILVTKIDRVSGGSKAGTRTGKLGKSVPMKNLSVFTRQLSVMIDAGLPLVEALQILGQQEGDANFSTTILDVQRAVESGVGLAEAMSRHPRTFDALYSSMVEAGEAAGTLDVILRRLAGFIEKSVKLKGQVKAALTYPAAIIVITVLVVGVILWKVIPTFASLFDGLGAALPLPTRVVIWMSDSFIGVFPLLLLCGGAATLGVQRFYRTSRGRRAVDGLLLRIPVLGLILRKIAVARFCRTLATLLGSGIPILDGLRITARTSGNAVVEDAIMTAREAIESGESIAGPLGETGVFPQMVTQMVNVGETTGTLDTMFAKIASFYEEEVDTSVGGMLTLIEPIMIAFLGVVVGGIVVAMYLPIFDLISRMAG